MSVRTHDVSLFDINIEVERFSLSHLSEVYQEGILITADTGRSTIETRISLELENLNHFGLLKLNYKGPEFQVYFPPDSTIKVSELLLKKSNTESNEFCLKDIQKDITYRDWNIKHIITKNDSDCRYLFEKAIKDNYTIILRMKLKNIDANNSSRQFALYLDNVNDVLLHRAIKEKDMKTIEVLVNFKLDINAKNQNGWTPLHVAVDLNMSDVVDLLISNGANVNASNNQLEVPLHYAAKNDNLKILDNLLKNQAKLDEKDKGGQTPLHYAVASGNVKIVDILLKKGANYKLTDRSDCTPFHLAAKHMNINVIKVFLDNYVDADIVNSRKKTPLHAIVETTATNTWFGNTAGYDDKITYVKIIKALVRKGANINFQDETGNTPLHHAVRERKRTFVQALLECNADVAIENNRGDNVLHWAFTSARSHNCVQVILDSNVDINAVDSQRNTALHKAIRWGEYDLVQFILRKNPNIHIKNNDGNTALHTAVKYKNFLFVKLLFKKGANVDSQNKLGKTALHLAIESKEPSIITFLLDNKANVNLKDSSGKTALHVALETPDIKIEIIKSILSSTNDIHDKDDLGRTAIHFATIGHIDMSYKAYTCVFNKNKNIANPYTERIRVLLDNKANINAVDNDLSTPLHHACCNKNVDAVKCLIKNGADSSMRDKNGKTVFHYACMMDWRYSFTSSYKRNEILNDIISILVRAGISVNGVDKFGKTPLHYVVEEDDDGSCNLYILLLEIGADINIEDKDHNTVFDKFFDRHSLSEYRKVAPFVKHVIKMKVMKMWVCKKTLDKIYKEKDKAHLKRIKNYEDDCNREINLMKNTNIDQSNISYYDFLTTSPDDAVNQNLVNAIESDKLWMKFPIYVHLLICHLREVQRCCHSSDQVQELSTVNTFKKIKLKL